VASYGNAQNPGLFSLFFFLKGQAKYLHTRMFEVCFICCLSVLHVTKKENSALIQDQILHSSLSHNSYLKSDQPLDTALTKIKSLCSNLSHWKDKVFH